MHGHAARDAIEARVIEGELLGRADLEPDVGNARRLGLPPGLFEHPLGNVQAHYFGHQGRVLELLGRVRETCLGAYGHQDLPFEKLVEELQPERDLSRTPLFQVMFVLQNAPMGGLKLGQAELTPLEFEQGTAKFDLTLSMAEGPEGIGATLEYNRDLFDGSTVARMLGHLRNVLEGMVANPEGRVAELELMSVAEREEVLERWNDTAVE
jgi:non-ribosomal peptide synthetase component F